MCAPRAQSNGGELLFSFTTSNVAFAVRARAISGSFQISTVALERYFVRRLSLDAVDGVAYGQLN